MKLLRAILSVITITTSVLLVISYLSQYISPEKVVYFAFAGLLFPYLFILNALLLIVNILLHRKLFFVGLAAALISYANVPRFYQLSGNSFEKSQITTLTTHKIISFNVRNFDLYNWNHNVETKNEILAFLRKENPDIICFQEFFYTSRTDFKFNPLDTLLKTYPHHYLHITTEMRGNDFWGLAVFSKYPLKNSRGVSFKFAKNNGFIATDVIFPNDTITLYNVHLASLHFGKEQYELINKLQSDTGNVELISESSPMIKLMKDAFVERAWETNFLADNIIEEKHPVMLCGDFNDTPSSFCYQHFRNYFKDAFITAGHGTGRTYIGNFPSFRIDYILYQPPIEIFDFTTYNIKLSDHKPVSADFYLKK